MWFLNLLKTLVSSQEVFTQSLLSVWIYSVKNQKLKPSFDPWSHDRYFSKSRKNIIMNPTWSDFETELNPVPIKKLRKVEPQSPAAKSKFDYNRTEPLKTKQVWLERFFFWDLLPWHRRSKQAAKTVMNPKKFSKPFVEI